MTISAATVLNEYTRPMSYLQFGEPLNLRLCNRIKVVETVTWERADFSVSGLTQSGSGIAALSLSMGNTDYVWSAYLLQMNDQVPVDLWDVYVTDAGTYETQKVFSGRVTQITESHGSSGSAVSISAIGVGPKYQYTPRIQWDHEEALGRGSKVIIAGITYVFE